MKYPFLIHSTVIPPYWHNFEFSTSGEAVLQADAMILSGDSYIKTEEGEPDKFIRVSQYNINRIDVYLE